MKKDSVITFGILLGITFISVQISNLIPKGYISASVIALFIGMLLNPMLSKSKITSVSQISKKSLQLGIILMGSTLNLQQVFQIGRYSLIIMCFTLLTAFLGGYLLGRVFKMDWKLSSLISAGAGICGGSAIAALSPVIGAEDKDVSYAISATFLFDIVMVILFPIAGRLLNMSDLGYGLWAGTAVNDTSSVVAAGYAFSNMAGEYAIIVKLTRTLAIIPVILIFSIISSYKNVKTQQKVTISKIFPYFILLFLVMVIIKSVGIIPDSISSNLSSISKYLLVMALAGIGLKTKFKDMVVSGYKPMLHGFLISLLVVVVSLGAQYLLGQI